MQMLRPKGRVAYEPNSLADDAPREDPEERLSQLRNGREWRQRGRVRPPASFADHLQPGARLFFSSQTAPEQAHSNIASALVFELSKVEALHIRQAMVGHLRHIDEGAGQGASPTAWLSMPCRMRRCRPQRCRT